MTTDNKDTQLDPVPTTEDQTPEQPKAPKTKEKKPFFTRTVKGALIGAAVGSIVPVFGTISGGVVGGLAGKLYDLKKQGKV